MCLHRDALKSYKYAMQMHIRWHAVRSESNSMRSNGENTYSRLFNKFELSRGKKREHEFKKYKNFQVHFDQIISVDHFEIALIC